MQFTPLQPPALSSRSRRGTRTRRVKEPPHHLRERGVTGFTFTPRRITQIKDKRIARVVLTNRKVDEVLVLRTGQKQIKIGVGPAKDMNRRKLIITARKAVSLAKVHRAKKIAITFSDFVVPKTQMTDRDVAELLAVNFYMANFEFTAYKSSPPGGWPSVERITVCGEVNEGVREGFRVGQVVGEEVNRTRMLANTPGGEMTPARLAAAAREAAKGLPVKVTVLGVAEMKRLKMNAVLGVGTGSSNKPKFIVLEYHGGAKGEKPVVLVGKGVTFDSGGINLKPSEALSGMHMDMSGGAAVIHVAVLAARLGVRRNVIALIPAAENMPSGSSYRPGDIVRTMSGKTIEILNTDAEGRVILADALTYAERYNPQLVVDVATLTGAAMVAIGQRASAIFTKSESLERLVRELGEKTGDYVWPLPLWDEYEEEIKGTFGDVANLGKTKYGGAITGAVFLYQFAKKYPWIHIDIAPRMTSVEGEQLAKGAAGAAVRLLIKLLEGLDPSATARHERAGAGFS